MIYTSLYRNPNIQRNFSTEVIKELRGLSGPIILQNHFEVILDILKMHPLDRTNDELIVLENATIHFPFFQQYYKKKRYIEAHIHSRCCRNIMYEYYERGSIIFKQDQGDPGDKMFFLIKGTINVYQYKSEQEINKEKDHESRQIYTSSNPKIKSFEENVRDSHQSSKESSHKKIRSIADFFDGNICTLKQINTVRQGAVIGEMALQRKMPRSATCVAADGVHLGVLTKKHFDEILYEFENERISKFTEFLSNNLKLNFTRDNAIKFSYLVEKTRFLLNSYIFKKGDPAEDFYMVKTGEVQLICQTFLREKPSHPVDSIEKQVDKVYQEDLSKNGVLKERMTKYVFPIQKLVSGHLLGEEILAGHEERICDAVTRSAKVTLLKVQKAKFYKYFSTLMDLQIPFIKRAEERTNWRIERINNSQELTDKFVSLKPEKEDEIISKPGEIYARLVKEKAINKAHEKEEEFRNTLTAQITSPTKYGRAMSMSDPETLRQMTAGDSFINMQYTMECNRKIFDLRIRDPNINLAKFDPIKGDVLFNMKERKELTMKKFKSKEPYIMPDHVKRALTLQTARRSISTLGDRSDRKVIRSKTEPVDVFHDTTVREENKEVIKEDSFFGKNIRTFSPDPESLKILGYKSPSTRSPVKSQRNSSIISINEKGSTQIEANQVSSEDQGERSSIPRYLSQGSLRESVINPIPQENESSDEMEYSNIKISPMQKQLKRLHSEAIPQPIKSYAYPELVQKKNPIRAMSHIPLLKLGAQLKVVKGKTNGNLFSDTFLKGPTSPIGESQTERKLATKISNQRFLPPSCFDSESRMIKTRHNLFRFRKNEIRLPTKQKLKNSSIII